jgi:hypothetical protein
VQSLECQGSNGVIRLTQLHYEYSKTEHQQKDLLRKSHFNPISSERKNGFFLTPFQSIQGILFALVLEILHRKSF